MGPLLQLTPLKISFILLILFTSQTSLTESATRTYGPSCNSCNNGPSSSFLGGQALGNGVRGVLGNKLEHIAGFFNGLGGGCGGCSSSCGSYSAPAHHSNTVTVIV